MNSKNKNILLFVSLFVILVILLDLVFNFSSILVENFENSVSASYNGSSGMGSSSNQISTNEKWTLLCGGGAHDLRKLMNSVIKM